MIPTLITAYDYLGGLFEEKKKGLSKRHQCHHGGASSAKAALFVEIRRGLEEVWTELRIYMAVD